MTGGAPSRRIIFLHIPKTGGATLQTIMVRNVPPWSVHLQGAGRGAGPGPLPPPVGGPRRLSRAELEHRELQHYSVDDLSRLGVVIGHYLYGVHEALPGPSTYVTMLRHPVERVLSLYQYRRTTDAVAAGIDEYVTSDRDLDLDDGQTTAIAGRVPHRPRKPEDMAGLLEIAKGNLLRTFTVVGITERFDESVALLGRTFRWRRLGYVPRNVGRGRPRRHDLSKETVERIVERNRFDLQLYSFATELFDRRLADLDPTIEDDVRRLRRRNAPFRRVPVLLRAADRVTRMRIDAARRKRGHSPTP